MTRSLRQSVFMSWQRIVALSIKELLAILKDRKSRIVLVVPPILQLLVFGYAATFDLNDIPVAVYNEDRSAPSRELVARIVGSPHFHLLARIDSDAQIAPLIDEKKVLVVLRLGQRFSADLYSGRTAKVQLIIDGRNSNTALLVQGYLRAIVNQFNLDWARSHGHPPPPATVEVRSWFNANLESRWAQIFSLKGKERKRQKQ